MFNVRPVWAIEVLDLLHVLPRQDELSSVRLYLLSNRIVLASQIRVYHQYRACDDVHIVSLVFHPDGYHIVRVYPQYKDSAGTWELSQSGAEALIEYILYGGITDV